MRQVTSIQALRQAAVVFKQMPLNHTFHTGTGDLLYCSHRTGTKTTPEGGFKTNTCMQKVHTYMHIKDRQDERVVASKLEVIVVCT